MEGPFFFFLFCEESVLDQHGPKLSTLCVVERMPVGWEKELWGRRVEIISGLSNVNLYSLIL